jgi:uncharacterized iron-regulated protein
MKKLVKKGIFALALLVAASCFTSCEEEIKGDENNDNTYSSILENYVNSTILPTYKALAEAALEMRVANEALKNYPTDENMQKASDAWMKARIAWEINEAFLFGPVGENALDVDGHTDSWPLELGEIQKSIAAGGTITGKEAWLLDSEVIGFHVTEYLLYRDGKTRPVADLTLAERNYLIAVTDALVWDCVLAYVAWIGEEKVSTEIQTVFLQNPDVKAHLEENANYKDFANKMKNGIGYSSLRDAVSEISAGAADIASEVGETKIAAPYNNKRTEEVESWYSWHSLEDYQNNIKSIKNAYLGGMDDNTRTPVSLSTYVAQKNRDLDNKIKARIEDCITKIAAIGTGNKSFYEVVRDQTNKQQVEAAVVACSELATLFTGLEDILE